MLEVDDNIPIPESERQARLNLARSIYANEKIGKRTAAIMAIDQAGIWPYVTYESAIDYLRNNIVEK